jgi:hypothetical protein
VACNIAEFRQLTPRLDAMKPVAWLVYHIPSYPLGEHRTMRPCNLYVGASRAWSFGLLDEGRPAMWSGPDVSIVEELVIAGQDCTARSFIESREIPAERGA